GLFDKFFADNLEKYADTTGAQWTWRPGSVNLSDGLLEQFQQARRIRDMFFSQGAKAPDVQFFVTMSDLDANATRAVLEIDGDQRTDTQHPRSLMKWPGAPPARAVRSFEATNYDPPKPYGGAWAWFRMIDDARVGTPDPQQRIMLNLKDTYHRVHVTVEPARATGNPFADPPWRQFKCES